MVSMQAWLIDYDFATTRNASLAPLYSDFEKQKEFFLLRKRQTQEVIDMLNDRIEAELTYAMRLDKISEYSNSFNASTGHPTCKPLIISFIASVHSRTQLNDAPISPRM